jgi:hypothetical protein
MFEIILLQCLKMLFSHWLKNLPELKQQLLCVVRNTEIQSERSERPPPSLHFFWSVSRQ